MPSGSEYCCSPHRAPHLPGAERDRLRVALVLVNSQAARRNAEALGVRTEKAHVIANVIDLTDFDARSASPHCSNGRYHDENIARG